MVRTEGLGYLFVTFSASSARSVASASCSTAASERRTYEPKALWPLLQGTRGSMLRGAGSGTQHTNFASKTRMHLNRNNIPFHTGLVKIVKLLYAPERELINRGLREAHLQTEGGAAPGDAGPLRGAAGTQHRN